MATDWNALKDEFGNKLKPYAKPGEYKAKVKDIKVDKTPKGSWYVSVLFEDTPELHFPDSAPHWLSRNNVNWCKWHHMNLMQVLGTTEEGAKKAVDKAESSENVEDVMAAYAKWYERLAEKHATVEVVVRYKYDKDGEVVLSKKGTKLTETELKDPRVFSDNTPKETKKTEEVEDYISEGEELSPDEIPF